MANLTPSEDIKRFGELENQASQFRALWDEIQRYVVPWRDPIQGLNHTGEKQTDRVFDSTAIHALTIASAAMHGMTTPSSTRWFSLVHPDPLMQEVLEVSQWLEDSSNRAMKAIQQSNFNQTTQELDSDLLAFGTGALYIRVKEATAGNSFPGFQFDILSPGSYVVAENADGIVDTIYRKFRMSVSAIFQKWGENSGKKVQDLMEAKKFDHRLWIVHSVCPRSGDVRFDNDLKVPRKNRPFMSRWMVLESDATLTTGNTQGSGLSSEPHVLMEDGLFEFPFLVPRWRKMSGEVYGRSPIIDALPDIRTLNQAVEFRLKAWSLAIAPPIASSDRGVIGDVRLIPFGRTTVRGNPRDVIMPIDIGANFNVANFQEEQLRDKIRQALFIEQIQSAQSQGLTPKSATEASINFEMMTRILGPVANRLQPEFLAPLVSNVFRMMQRHNAVLPAPADLLESGGSLDVIYEGPLSRAQSIQEVDAVSRWLQIALPIAEIDPSVIAWVDFSELGKALADAVSIPKKVMKSREQVESELAQAKEQRANQQMQANMLAGAEVINKVSPAVTRGPAG